MHYFILLRLTQLRHIKRIGSNVDIWNLFRISRTSTFRTHKRYVQDNHVLLSDGFKEKIGRSCNIGNRLSGDKAAGAIAAVCAGT